MVNLLYKFSNIALNNVSTMHVNKKAESPTENSFKLFHFQYVCKFEKFLKFPDGKKISFT